jgi:hypothetical protein
VGQRDCEFEKVGIEDCLRFPGKHFQEFRKNERNRERTSIAIVSRIIEGRDFKGTGFKKLTCRLSENS